MNKNNNCIFCNPTDIVINGEYAYSRFDGYPVSEGHCLIIPKRHVPKFENLTDFELKDMYVILQQTKQYIEDNYSPDGFNIGINEGEAAGQTVPHLHIHLIPRYEGDVVCPRGGVRGVIPSRKEY